MTTAANPSAAYLPNPARIVLEAIKTRERRPVGSAGPAEAWLWRVPESGIGDRGTIPVAWHRRVRAGE